MCVTLNLPLDMSCLLVRILFKILSLYKEINLMFDSRYGNQKLLLAKAESFILNYVCNQINFRHQIFGASIICDKYFHIRNEAAIRRRMKASYWTWVYRKNHNDLNMYEMIWLLSWQSFCMLKYDCRYLLGALCELFFSFPFETKWHK